ncbi:MAG: type I methionyl aminopeptidase [Gemmataceae bacterium]|nr:type I methionyl aminopeptidase [Gemmataceae bacterium]MDW8265713.1 type I methionyl aminopeptidase [Gemmataceae bacterium]
MLRKFINRVPELKTRREIGLMREAGNIVAEALRLCRQMAQPGVRTGDIDRAVEALYAARGAIPLFKGYPGRVPFPAVTCISINEQVVHGIPGPRVIREGDLVKIDTACKLNGWCADAAITLMIGDVSPERRRLVRVAEEALHIAMIELGRAHRWSEVAMKMQHHVERAGFSMVQNYVGHGIGRIMHENPQVPNFVSRDTRKHDFKIEEGLVLAVEPMVNMGTMDTQVLSDHWTVVTRDGLASAHVEHTLAVTADGVVVLTADEDTIVPPGGPVMVKPAAGSSDAASLPPCAG